MGAAVAVLVACLLLVVLSVWVPGRHRPPLGPGPWRPFAASVGAALGLALTGWLAVLSFPRSRRPDQPGRRVAHAATMKASTRGSRTTGHQATGID